MAHSSDETEGFEAELEEFWNENWSCRTEFIPSRKLVTAIADEDFMGSAGDDSMPPFLIATLPPVFRGVVVFIKQTTGWSGIAIEGGHIVQGAFLAPGKGRMIVFTMHGVEGPGHEFAILHTHNGFAQASCSTLEFPDEVPGLETFMQLVDFNADERGDGFLLGSAELEDKSGESRTMWFRFRTTDGGASWSSPEVLEGQPDPVAGIYSPVGAEGLSELIADLQRSAS